MIRLILPALLLPLIAGCSTSTSSQLSGTPSFRQPCPTSSPLPDRRCGTTAATVYPGGY